MKYEYLCECVILLFVFQFSASVLEYVSVPGLSMNICVNCVILLFVFQFSASVLVFVFIFVFQD